MYSSLKPFGSIVSSHELDLGRFVDMVPLDGWLWFVSEQASY